MNVNDRPILINDIAAQINAEMTHNTHKPTEHMIECIVQRAFALAGEDLDRNGMAAIESMNAVFDECDKLKTRLQRIQNELGPHIGKHRIDL